MHSNNHYNQENGFYTNGVQQATEEESSIDLSKIASKVFAMWPWMLLGAIVMLCLAYAYLYITKPIYNINAEILIKEDDKKGGGVGNNATMSALSSMGLFGGVSSADNELEILKTYNLMDQVVREMQLNVVCVKNNVREDELYGKNNPFNIRFSIINEDSLLKKPLEYLLQKTTANTYILTDKKNAWKGVYGDSLTIPVGRLVISQNNLIPNNNSDDVKEKYKIIVANTSATVNSYMKALTATIPNKQVTAIQLILQNSVPQKGVDVMNRLINTYVQANVEDKNRVADSTIAFIDARLSSVTQDLTKVEKSIQDFMQRNDLADINAQSKVLIENTGEYQKILAQEQIQLNVIESLDKYLKENQNNPRARIVPMSSSIKDPTLTATINTYNELLLQRERLILGAKEDNPLVQNIDAQIAQTRSSLNNAITSAKNSSIVTVNALQQKTGSIESKIKDVPPKQREFLEYGRQQNIKQELYVFLLQKKEEALISKSSTIANVRVIDPARAEPAPAKPKKAIILAVAVFLGLLLPLLFTYLKDILNTRIANKKDIESLTSLPIVGEVGHSKSNSPIIVTKESRDVVAEQFRILRTGLQFMLTETKDKVIVFTSSMPGEGKSFVATNLAAALALAGNKVVLMEMDLRKPKISDGLGISRVTGFSSYIIGKNTLEDILIPYSSHPGLSVIPSGPIPPNPSELLINKKTKILFEELRQRFDYIIVDCAPNLVTDAQILGKYADATLYLVRVGVTHKDQLKIPNDYKRFRKMPNIGLVVNDVKPQGRYGGGYYGYGYNYGEGYYGEEKKNVKKSKENI